MLGSDGEKQYAAAFITRVDNFINYSACHSAFPNSSRNFTSGELKDRRYYAKVNRYLEIMCSRFGDLPNVETVRISQKLN